MLDLDLNRRRPDGARRIHPGRGAGRERRRTRSLLRRTAQGWLSRWRGRLPRRESSMRATSTPNGNDCSTPPRPNVLTPIAADAAALRGLAIAACREALEEAAILPIAGAAADARAAPRMAARTGSRARPRRCGPCSPPRGLRSRSRRRSTLFARWITPGCGVPPLRHAVLPPVRLRTARVTGAHDDRRDHRELLGHPG